MIDNICFTKEWIYKKAREIGRADPVLLEKTILAFTILSGLSRSQIPFVFKGGTSLILLLKDFRDPINDLLDLGKNVILFATARVVSSELNELKAKGLFIFDIKKIKDFICWKRERSV